MACLLPSLTLQAGKTVRLFHREYECYIAAEGSFAGDPSVVEDGQYWKGWSTLCPGLTLQLPPSSALQEAAL